MAVFQEPTQWSHELGNNADVSTLPDDTSATTGVASLQKLFQIINQTPLEAGGVAPDREDFNALFKYLGDQIFYTQNGGIPSYNNSYDYAIGRVVLYNGNIYKCIQANGASSTVVAPDSVDPVGSDYWGLLLTSSDLSNFANTDLSNLSASGQAIIDGKADKDFSNVTNPVQAFKTMSVSWGMPNYSAVLSNVGNNYTAPSDGYYMFSMINTVTPGNNARTIYINGISFSRICNNYGTDAGLCIPLAKGDIIYIESTSAPLKDSYFVPCKGV